MSRSDPPGWVPPARLPDDLPPHERWVRPEWEVWGAPAKHPPPTAPGFARASRLGLLPASPPVDPPRPIPGPSAGLLFGLGGLAFVSPLALVATMEGTAAFAYVGPAYALLSFAAAMWLLHRGSRRAAVESAAGYTTTIGSPGLWRLTPFGRPVRPPDRTCLPDGFYPSPYWPGVLQKWEGRSWKPFVEDWWRHPEQWFRTPDVPYLDGPS